MIRAPLPHPLPISGEMRTAENLMFASFDDNGTMKWKADLEVQTDNDTVDEDHGKITVTLNDPDSDEPEAYTVSTMPGENSAEVTVNDNEVPEIDIVSEPETIATQKCYACIDL